MALCDGSGGPLAPQDYKRIFKRPRRTPAAWLLLAGEGIDRAVEEYVRTSSAMVEGAGHPFHGCL
jgi:hypothetical protein